MPPARPRKRPRWRATRSKGTARSGIVGRAGRSRPGARQAPALARDASPGEPGDRPDEAVRVLEQPPVPCSSSSWTPASDVGCREWRSLRLHRTFRDIQPVTATEGQLRLPRAHDVAVGEPPSPVQPRLIHERAVGRHPVIDQPPLVAHSLDLGMPPGHPAVPAEGHVAALGTTDGPPGRRTQGDDLGLAGIVTVGQKPLPHAVLRRRDLKPAGGREAQGGGSDQHSLRLGSLDDLLRFSPGGSHDAIRFGPGRFRDRWGVGPRTGRLSLPRPRRGAVRRTNATRGLGSLAGAKFQLLHVLQDDLDVVVDLGGRNRASLRRTPVAR